MWEDLIVKFIFDCLEIKTPRTLILASSPYYILHSFIFMKWFYGINIEPDPVLFMKFCEERTRDINLKHWYQ
jgi:hypothetical protein